ncbi:MAG: hypothetical protein R2932_37450 [Caldilineaceae bacterium]
MTEPPCTFLAGLLVYGQESLSQLGIIQQQRHMLHVQRSVGRCGE